MTPTSETRGIVLMLLLIALFIANALALAFPACDGWLITLFRGMAGTVMVVALYSRSGQLRLRSLLATRKVHPRASKIRISRISPEKPSAQSSQSKAFE